MPEHMDKMRNGAAIKEGSKLVIESYQGQEQEREVKCKKDGKSQSYLRAPTFSTVNEFSELPCVKANCGGKSCYAHMACLRPAINLFKKRSNV
jgi:hypothetical protein